MLPTDLILVTILIWSLNEATTIYNEVLINAPTNISCIPNEDIQIQWHHTAPSGSLNYVYAGGAFKNEYRNRGFRLEKDSNTGPYYLVIPHARGEDAGLYDCKEDDGSRTFGSTNLTVLESIPVCETNMKREGYVGASTCNLQQDDMTFTCAVSFKGNPPQMTWKTLNDSQSFNESTCKIESGRINCSLTIRADSKYDGSIFSCQSIQSSAECRTEIIKIHYFESQLDDGRPPVVVKNMGDKVICSVESKQEDLKFEWTFLQNYQPVFLTNDKELLIHNLQPHRCSAYYSIGDDKCDALVIEVIVNNPCETQKKIIIALATFFAISLVVSVVLFMLKEKIRKKWRNRRSRNPRRTDISEQNMEHRELSTGL